MLDAVPVAQVFSQLARMPVAERSPKSTPVKAAATYRTWSCPGPAELTVTRPVGNGVPRSCW
jgi:hypothetical protein